MLKWYFRFGNLNLLLSVGTRLGLGFCFEYDPKARVTLDITFGPGRVEIDYWL